MGAISIVVVLGLFGAAAAGQLEDGEAAYYRSDYTSALRLLRPLAEQGDAKAQAYIGTMYFVGQGVPQNYAQGVAWITKCANQGVVDAQFELGSLYLSGFGVARNAAAAASWFRKAADRDGTGESADAQLQLGRLYSTGDGVPQDDAQADKWFGKAAISFQKGADRGGLASKMKLASMYENGEGVHRDKGKAISLYLEVAASSREAAERGDIRAQYRLAQMYFDGRGVAKDRLQAAIWYRRAADQGDINAQNELSMIYMYSFSDILDDLGAPGPEDKLQGYVWFMLGGAHLPSAMVTQLKDIRESMRAELTPDQIAEAKRLIDSWRPVTEAPRADGGAIEMTLAQKAEAERLRREWLPSLEEIDRAEQPARSFDMTLGSPNAKITVIEYASLACPHCARFNNETFPAFKAQYIDTGKVRYVFREFLVGDGDEASFAAAAFLTARCAGKDKYFNVLDAIFRAQESMYQSRDFRGGLLRIASFAGLTEDQFNACVSDNRARTALKDRVNTFEKYDHIGAVPTFIIGDQKYVGEQSLADLNAAIGRALGLPVPAPSIHAVNLWKANHPSAWRGFFIRLVDKEAGDDPAEVPPKSGDERISQIKGRDLWLEPGVVITGDMIADAYVDDNEFGRPFIGFRLTQEGHRRLTDFTTAHVGRQFAVVWDGMVISTPIIVTPVTDGRGIITGSFTPEFAKELVSSLMKSKF